MRRTRLALTLLETVLTASLIGSVVVAGTLTWNHVAYRTGVSGTRAEMLTQTEQLFEIVRKDIEASTYCESRVLANGATVLLCAQDVDIDSAVAPSIQESNAPNSVNTNGELETIPDRFVWYYWGDNTGAASATGTTLCRGTSTRDKFNSDYRPDTVDQNFIVNPAYPGSGRSRWSTISSFTFTIDVAKRATVLNFSSGSLIRDSNRNSTTTTNQDTVGISRTVSVMWRNAF